MTDSEAGSIRDELVVGRRLGAKRWLALAGAAGLSFAAWRLSGHPATAALGALLSGGLLASFVSQSRANRRAIRYADLASLQLRLKNEMLCHAREVAAGANRAKDAFFARMGPELRTPLNTAIGLTQAMLDGELAPEQREHAEHVLEASESLLATLEDMLDLARLEATALSFVSVTFDLHRTLGEAFDEIAPRAEEKGLTLTRLIDPDLARVREGDPRRVRQVLVNLLCNAIDFTEEGGVELRAGRDASGDPDVLRVELRDTGVGVDPEQRKRLFQAFEDVDAVPARRSGGAGLGLPISKRLVEEMGGQIGYEPRPEGGSIFWFSLPLARCAEPLEKAAAAAPPSLLGRRVLIAEDSVANQRVALAILGSEPDVSVVSNGREACDLLAERDFDVVLMDVEMPEMDGLAAAGEIRAREPETGRRTPIVAMTAHVHADDRSLCLAAGMDDYVSKPVRREELFAALGRVLQGAPGSPSA